jgi:hypothetical protein
VKISDLELFDDDRIIFRTGQGSFAKEIMVVGDELQYLPDYDVLNAQEIEYYSCRQITLEISAENYEDLLNVLETI